MVIGAGMGGLAAAIRLASAGMEVTLVEAAAHLGGKMRTLDTAAGPVDAGPTVLTLKPVFEDLFASAGQDMANHLTLAPLPVLARHWWPDGASLDLFCDGEASAVAIRAFAGPSAEVQFRRFSRDAAALRDQIADLAPRLLEDLLCHGSSIEQPCATLGSPLPAHAGSGPRASPAATTRRVRAAATSTCAR